jgi:hypothetical protein
MFRGGKSITDEAILDLFIGCILVEIIRLRGVVSIPNE